MNTVDYDPAKMDRSNYLNEKSYPQLKEILTNYGKIDIIWFDMGGGLSEEETSKFERLARQLQPEIIISSRIGNSDVSDIDNPHRHFDYYTPSDNYFTGDDLPIPWEMCGTTNGSWGYRKDDEEWRDSKMILNSLIACTSRNGNYLLNVGPMGNGEIPNAPITNLIEAGKWLEVNGESVYGTKGSSFLWNYNWGYVTEKPHKTYLHIFNWPKNNTLELLGLESKITSANMLNKNNPLNFVQEGDILTIPLDNLEKTDLATVIVLTHDDETIKIKPIITQSKNNDIRLDRISGQYIKDSLLLSWTFKVKTPGAYKIKLFSNEKASHSNPDWVGSDQTGTIDVANQTISVVLKRDEEKINKSLFFYKEITSFIGEITFNSEGIYTLKLKGIDINAGKWTNGLGLNYIELTPL